MRGIPQGFSQLSKVRSAIRTGVAALVISLVTIGMAGNPAAYAAQNGDVTPTATATALPTNTPTVVSTNTPTIVPTNTPTVVATNTPTAAATSTPTVVPAATSTPVPTIEASPTPTYTPTAVPTQSTPSPTPTATPQWYPPVPPIDSSPYTVTGPNPSLTRLLNRETNLLSNEERRLGLAASVISEIQDFIADQNSKGKNTSRLQAALAEFQKDVADAQSHHDAAANYLNFKLGFNSSGAVVDAELARGTLRAVGMAQRRFHRSMDHALHQFFTAIIRYEEANA